MPAQREHSAAWEMSSANHQTTQMAAGTLEVPRSVRRNGSIHLIIHHLRHDQSKFRQPLWGKGRLHRTSHSSPSSHNLSEVHQPLWGKGWLHSPLSNNNQSIFRQPFSGEEVHRCRQMSCFSEFLIVVIHAPFYHYYLGSKYLGNSA